MIYQSLDDILRKKELLREELSENRSEISGLWNELFHEKPASSKGEQLSQIFNTALSLYDGFMLARGLMKRYSRLRSRLFF